MPASHHSVFYRLNALLPPSQQRQSTEGMYDVIGSNLQSENHEFDCGYFIPHNDTGQLVHAKQYLVPAVMQLGK